VATGTGRYLFNDTK